MSKPIDWSKYGVVYAGTWKNVGPAGVTFVIAWNDHVAGHRSDNKEERRVKGKAPKTFFIII